MNFHAAVKIADKGLENIYSMQDAFLNLRAVLIMIRDSTPSGTVTNDFAKLGILEVHDWMDRSADWAETMRVELDSLDFGTPTDSQPEAQAPTISMLNNDSLRTIEGLLNKERSHATKWWTCLNELRIRNQLPDWLKSQDVGSSIEHDLMQFDRIALNDVLFANNAETLYETMTSVVFSGDLNSQTEE